MDDPKRQFTILLVIGVVVAGVYLAGEIFREEPAEGADGTDQSAQAADDGSSDPDGASDSAEEEAEAGPALTPEARLARAENETLYTVETDLFEAAYTDRTAALVRFTVRDPRFTDEHGQPMQLVTTDQEEFLPQSLEVRGVNLPPDATWRGESLPDERAVRFTWEGNGFRVVRRIQAGEGPYQLWSTISVTSLSDATRPVRVVAHTHHYVTREAEDAGFIGRPSTAMSFGLCRWGEGDVEREDGSELLEPMGFSGNVEWAGAADSYFANVMAPHGELGERCTIGAQLRGGTLEEPHGTLFSATVQMPRVELGPGETHTTRFLAYMGPSDRDALRTAGHHLSQVIDLGWFSFIADGLTEVLSAIQSKVGNWGVAIILLTLLVKLIFYPLTAKSFASMAAMRRLKPQIDKINEECGDDREKRGQRTMALYKREGVNPAAGCLPMLLQMPVWFALYRSLSTNIELYHAPFALWWQDLSAPDPFYVLPIIVALLMFVQQSLTPNTMDPMQAKLMKYGMPLIFGSFMLFLPSGLCLYIVTNSTLSITQQRLLYRRLDREAAEREAGPTSVDDAGDSGDDDEDDDQGSLEPATAGASASSTRRRVAKKKKKRSRR